MAEYVEVMRQKKRMCNSTLCCKCDIFCLCGENIGNCPKFISNNPSKAEKIIMEWAAEHPEPVYPTWEEWLSDKYNLAYNDDFRLAMSREHIPADTAQKLGIEPKEGV